MLAHSPVSPRPTSLNVSIVVNEENGDDQYPKKVNGTIKLEVGEGKQPEVNADENHKPANEANAAKKSSGKVSLENYGLFRSNFPCRNASSVSIPHTRMFKSPTSVHRQKCLSIRLPVISVTLGIKHTAVGIFIRISGAQCQN
jgi:hypothetical protein